VHEVVIRSSPFDEHVESLGTLLTRYESLP